jgi:AAHS family benzoate transporter-like MFS transporter
MSSSTTKTRRPANATTVIALCFATIAFDGFDLVVYGTIVPSLLAYEPWSMTPQQTGLIGGYALFGMLIGGLLVGYLTDILGRRRVMIAGVAFFSLLMIACAVAPTSELFGLFRFLAGIGLGGVIPTAIALTIEYSAPGRRNFNNALMFSGYGLGGVAAALSAIVLLQHVGFRGLLAIGGLPLILIVPILWRFLPESPAFLTTHGKHAEAAILRARYGLTAPAVAPSSTTGEAKPRSARFSQLLQGRWLLATVLFTVAGIAGQTLIYGLNTWLPQLMVLAGYSLTSSLTFLLTVNFGAIAGALISSRLADRFGARLVTALSFVTSAISLTLMGTGIAGGATMYLLLAFVGFGSVGAQILLNGFVGTYYPDVSRASALGITLGLGRLGAIFAITGGGWLIAANVGTFTNFIILALAAVTGLAALLIVPRHRGTSADPAREMKLETERETV